MIVPANGLAASFVAHLPTPSETRMVMEHTEWVRGNFAFRSGRRAPHFREVFEAYYNPGVEKGVETAPHILFARCPDDAESIVRFTNEWGPLHHPRTGEPQSGFDPAIFSEDERRELHKHFYFTLFWWRSVQSEFKKTIVRLAEPDWPAWQTGSPENGPLLTSTLRFQFVRTRDALAPQLTIGSLIEAFWLMLWLDTAAGSRRVRICSNERCKQPFRAGRSDQIYCSERCRACVNKRNHWTLKGSERRRENRKQ